jgi:trehalose 6-phosphate phosphatase
LPDVTTLQDLPPFEEAALLLDVDGTLLDFAPTPDSVVVPPDLLASLHRLRPALGGALGVISGRPVEQVERLLRDTPHAIAGEHGGAIRHGPGEALDRPELPSAPEDWLREAEQLVANYPGAEVERKARGFVLHYRKAASAGPALGEWLRARAAERPREFEVLDSNMAWELRPRGADKGLALAALMSRPPFAGRKPVFIGDDVTDHDGIRMARRMGGAGLLVADAFGGPAEVRAWLASVAARGGW